MYAENLKKIGFSEFDSLRKPRLGLPAHQIGLLYVGSFEILCPILSDTLRYVCFFCEQRKNLTKIKNFSAKMPTPKKYTYVPTATTFPAFWYENITHIPHCPAAAHHKWLYFFISVITPFMLILYHLTITISGLFQSFTILSSSEASDETNEATDRRKLSQ